MHREIDTAFKIARDEKLGSTLALSHDVAIWINFLRIQLNLNMRARETIIARNLTLQSGNQTNISF